MKPAVLIVDDDDQVRETLLLSVQGMGLDAAGVSSAEAAMEILQDRPFWVAIVDVRLGGRSGLALLKWIRCESPDTDVIIITGYGNIPIAMQAISAGAVHFFEKPVSRQLLIGAIADVVTARQRASDFGYAAMQELVRDLAARVSYRLGRVETSILVQTGGRLDVIASTSGLRQAERREAEAGELTRYELQFGRKQVEEALRQGTIVVSRSCNPVIKIADGENEIDTRLSGLVCVPFSSEGDVRGTLNVYAHNPFRLTNRVRTHLLDLSRYVSLFLQYLHYRARWCEAHFEKVRLAEFMEALTYSRSEQDPKARRSGSLSEFGKMIAGIRHDLVSALGVIETNISEVLSRELSSASIQDDLRRMHLASRYCALLLGNLSDLVERTRAMKSGLDIRILVDEVLEMLSNRIAPEIRVRRDYPSSIAQIVGDRGQIQRALMNLIENAVDAMRGRGELSISVRYRKHATTQGGGEIVLGIGDTGVGIRSENLERIFDLSFSTKREGYGLGLYITKNIIERHKGTIRVESEEGRGARFTLRFPVEDIER